MPRLGFEPTIPVFERVKAFYVLYRVVTAIGEQKLKCRNFSTEIHADMEYEILSHTGGPAE
jgi:hypothetical protein